MSVTSDIPSERQAAIDEHKRAFKKAGGRVTRIKPGVSGEQFQALSREEQKTLYRNRVIDQRCSCKEKK